MLIIWVVKFLPATCGINDSQTFILWKCPLTQDQFTVVFLLLTLEETLVLFVYKVIYTSVIKSSLLHA